LLVTVFSPIGVVATQSAPQGGNPATAAGLSSAIENTAKATSAAVVQIFATSFAPGRGLVSQSGDLVTTERASGSGVIVARDGYIVTNAHVVAGARRIRVEIPTASAGQSVLATRSRQADAEVVGIDEETDLAVLRVAAVDLTALTFGDSEELKPGQLLLAVGSPLGLQNSVSLGVVSAVARQLVPESPMIYVQTDASINPGSSGGALVDLNGRLVGINTLNASRGGGSDGIGFAAPSNIVRTVYEQIRASGRVRRGDIGIRAQTITPVLASGLGLSRQSGAILGDVAPGSPASKAGLQPGDIVLSLDGKPIENGRQLSVSLYRRRIGDVVNLEVLRGSQTLRLSVPVGERADPLARLPPPDPRQQEIASLGILGVTLDAAVLKALPWARVRTGVVVITTVQGALDSREGGLAMGDVIYAVNRVPINAVDELRAAMNGRKPGDAVVLHLDRRGQLMYLAFTVE
jgi:serine protease Do